MRAAVALAANTAEPDVSDVVRRLETSDATADDLARRVELLEALVKDLVLTGAVARPPRAREAVAALRGGEGRWLVVRVAGRRLGLPLEAVREVVRSAALEPVPGGARALEGLLDLRGESVEVVDLRIALGAAPLDDDLDARLVVTRSAVEVGQRSVAFKVDEAAGLTRVTAADVERPPELSSAEYLVGVVRPEVEGEPPLLLLDPGRLVAALVERDDVASDLSPGAPDDQRGDACTSPG